MADQIEEVVRRLHEEAANGVGLGDFGGDPYLEAFRVYLGALVDDLGLVDVESLIAAARPSALLALTGRLHVVAGWRRYAVRGLPQIERPIFITGMPRTGTTALHHIMGLDAQFQGLESWLIRSPMPRPPRAAWPDISAYRERVADAAATRDRLRSSHWVAADAYDECQLLMSQTFVSNTFGSQRSVPTYDRWYLAHDHRPAFHRLRDVLRLVAAGDGGTRRWLLKNPSHLISLDSLFDAFPDAEVVITHRDPVRAIPSLCSLLWTTRQMRAGATADLDPTLIGRREIAMWSGAVARMERVVAEHGAAVHHVYQRDLRGDPLGTVTSLAARLGVGLSPGTESAIARWVANDLAESSDHRYTRATFGFNEADLRKAFADYRERYGFA